MTFGCVQAWGSLQTKQTARVLSTGERLLNYRVPLFVNVDLLDPGVSLGKVTIAGFKWMV